MRIRKDIIGIFNLTYPQRSSRVRRLERFDMILCDEKTHFAQDYDFTAQLKMGKQSLLVHPQYSAHGAMVRALSTEVARLVDAEILKNLLKNDVNTRWDVIIP
jgi:hypothetical protein